jgi:uncharacterized membrane protein YkoI
MRFASGFMFASCAFGNLLLTTKTTGGTMRKRTIATLATTAVLALGVIGTTALAETPPPSAPPSAQPQAPKTGTKTETQEPKINGTIPAPKDAAGAETTEAAETAALAGLAKVSEADARNAALAKFPGATITKASLGDENGFIVWSVELTDASKASQEVKIDAGSGAVLAVEAGGADNEKSGTSGTDTD